MLKETKSWPVYYYYLPADERMKQNCEREFKDSISEFA